MIHLKPNSGSVLALAGSILVCLGLYFMLLRPPFLPEDQLYIGSTLENIRVNIPGLLHWLQKVFWVMGSWIFTTGILIVFMAFTTFRTRRNGALIVIIIAGISSIGSMTVVNFIIGSDFRWLLLTFTLPWFISLILYKLHK